MFTFPFIPTPVVRLSNDGTKFAAAVKGLGYNHYKLEIDVKVFSEGLDWIR